MDFPFNYVILCKRMKTAVFKGGKRLNENKSLIKFTDRSFNYTSKKFWRLSQSHWLLVVILSLTNFWRHKAKHIGWVRNKYRTHTYTRSRVRNWEDFNCIPFKPREKVWFNEEFLLFMIWIRIGVAQTQQRNEHYSFYRIKVLNETWTESLES